MRFFKITPPNSPSFFSREPVSMTDVHCESVPVTRETEQLLTLEEIREQADTLCEWLIQNRGYNDAKFSSCYIYRSSIGITLDLCDDFQENLKPEDRCECGYISISCERLCGDWTRWITREMRELHVMATKVSTDPELLSQVQSAQAKQFVIDLMAKSDQLKNLLAAPRASS